MTPKLAFAALLFLTGCDGACRSSSGEDESRSGKKESSLVRQLLDATEERADDLLAQLVETGNSAIPSVSSELESFDHPNRRRLCRALWRIVNNHGDVAVIPDADKTSLAAFNVELSRSVWPEKPTAPPHFIFAQGAMCKPELAWAIRDTQRQIKIKTESGQDFYVVGADKMVLERLEQTLRTLNENGE